MEKKSINLKNGEMYYYIEYGKGDKTLILLHGNLSSCLFYKPILREFEGYRVIALDMRGFGDSTYNKKIDSMEDLADDLKIFMDRMDIKKADVLGWSAGGTVALQFAAKYPSLVNKLILKASASYRGYPIFKKNELGHPIVGSYYQTREEMAKDPINVLPVYFMLLNKDKTNLKLIYDYAIYNINKPKDYEYEMQLNEIVKQRNIIDFDWALTSFNMSDFSNGVTDGDGSIKNVVCPVLSLWGDKDMTVMKYMIDETVEALDNAKKIVIKDAGHSIMTDQFDTFISEIKTFLKE